MKPLQEFCRRMLKVNSQVNAREYFSQGDRIHSVHIPDLGRFTRVQTVCSITSHLHFFDWANPKPISMDYERQHPSPCSSIDRHDTSAATHIMENKQLEPLLGIFQQLVSTRTNEIQAFELLEGIISNFPV